MGILTGGLMPCSDPKTNKIIYQNILYNPMTVRSWFDKLDILAKILLIILFIICFPIGIIFLILYLLNI